MDGQQVDAVTWTREIGILLPNNQRQHRTSHVPKDVLPYAYLLVTVLRVSRSCELFLDGFDLHLLHLDQTSSPPA